MGRLIGSFMDDNELDRPDLNKCPDCECYFPQDNCPICGKECPEEMRAGNRKVQKAKKHRNGRSTAVQIVDWYHRWWFIILMLIIFPIGGIVLLATSPHNKVLKSIVISVVLVYNLSAYFGYGPAYIGNVLKNAFDKPVDTSLTYEEYTDKCEGLSAEAYYRDPDGYKDRYVKMELTVNAYAYDSMGEYEGERYNDYYLCEGSDADGKKYSIIVRQCVQSGVKNLAEGDTVIVYGECAGRAEFFDSGEGQYRTGACINAAYFELVK